MAMTVICADERCGGLRKGSRLCYRTRYTSKKRAKEATYNRQLDLLYKRVDELQQETTRHRAELSQKRKSRDFEDAAGFAVIRIGKDMFRGRGQLLNVSMTVDVKAFEYHLRGDGFRNISHEVYMYTQDMARRLQQAMLEYMQEGNIR